ncbi:MAG: hypothetical protein FJX45_06470 [Alphaproteobacteria bacterium]|nr:hypothetical protein [Alphaproteobacteria bacterium]
MNTREEEEDQQIFGLSAESSGSDGAGASGRTRLAKGRDTSIAAMIGWVSETARNRVRQAEQLVNRNSGGRRFSWPHYAAVFFRGRSALRSLSAQSRASASQPLGAQREIRGDLID